MPLVRSLMWLLLCARLAAPAAAAEERRIAEPVFGGEALVVLAGAPEAPPVVLIHGIGERAARDWQGLIAVLARDHRVLAFDLPGFGRSSAGNHAYTPERYAAFVRYAIERELGPRPVGLVGHSLGGAVALRYAARHPEDVSALVLVAVPGLLHRAAYSKYLVHLGLDRLPGLYPAQGDHLRNLASNLLGLVERLRPTPEAIVANADLRRRLLDADPARIAGLALAIEDFTADLPRVGMPTLLLWGGRDEIAPRRNGETLAAMLPHARLEVLAASGHTPMDEVPESFNARVAAFLRDPALVADARGRPAAGAAATRQATCRGQRDVLYEGDYDRLVISRCRGVRVRDARVRQLRIVESTVSIERSHIGGPDGGLVADDARVTVTASRIEAEVAIRAVAARLDIAGTRLIGTRAAVEAPLASDLLFSLSEIDRPGRRGPVHGLWRVQPGEPL